MDLDDALGKTLFGEEASNLQTLITLQLDDLAEFFVLYEGAVAREFLKIGSRSVNYVFKEARPYQG